MDSLWKDPDVFRPERWLSDLPPPQDLCSGWANLLAFSDGPRNCVGLRLGEYTLFKCVFYVLCANGRRTTDAAIFQYKVGCHLAGAPYFAR